MKDDTHKHTPGPWAIKPLDRYEQDEGPPEGLEIVGSDGTTICCNQTYYPTPLEPRNARLIAAAPDLLTALETLVNDLLGDMVTEEEGVDLWADAITAIALATGEGEA